VATTLLVTALLGEAFNKMTRDLRAAKQELTAWSDRTRGR